jgi:hypothetical protein
MLIDCLIERCHLRTGGDESISILHVSLLVISGNSVDVLIISLSYI